MNERLLAVIQHSPLWKTRSAVTMADHGPKWAQGVDMLWYLRAFGQRLPGVSDESECVEHYLNTIRNVPVSPNAAFDEVWYRSRYPDIERMIGIGKTQSGWHHYLESGSKEQRNPTWWFDEAWYQSKNPDVRQAVRSTTLICGFEHYLAYGVRTGLHPSIYFDPDWYRLKYLAGRDVLPLVDCLSSKHLDSRCPAPFFDSQWYRSQYLVDGEFQSDQTGRARSTLEHYLFFGRRLGYSPSPRFNEQDYLASNPDVTQKVNSGLYASGWEHYVAEGVLQGLAVSTHFTLGGLDYAGPRFLEIYEQSMLLNLRQLHRIRQLSGR